jgi:hypothetical protein
MLFDDYKKAFDILSSVKNMFGICLEKVQHSADGKWIVFVTSNPNIRYFVELKTGKVARKELQDCSTWQDKVEWLN